MDFRALLPQWLQGSGVCLAAEMAIERLLDRLDRLDTDEAGESLVARLKAREAERDALRLKLAPTVAPKTLVITKAAELEAIYRQQIARLEALLTGSDQIVEANALLRERPRGRLLVGESDVGGCGGRI